jgi:hypothetical protein
VTVGVDDCHELTREQAEVVPQRIGQSMIGARVDDRQPGIAADGTDRLVERLVSADPDPVSDLPPAGGHASAAIVARSP